MSELETSPLVAPLVTASDGLAARQVGPWSEEKLHYIAAYIDIFTTSMKAKWPRRLYVDLFSGPGKCVLEGSGKETDGSPLLALNAKYPFTDLYFNDKEPAAIEALRRRTPESASQRLVFDTEDCNDAARNAVRALDFGGDSLGLAVIDPTGFQIHFDAIADMTRSRRVDLIITFMSQHLKRFIGEPQLKATLDAFFGGQQWHSLVVEKDTTGRLTTRALLDHYESRLEGLGYSHVSDHIRILNTRGSPLYHLVFASKHELGKGFFNKISRRRFGGQQQLL